LVKEGFLLLRQFLILLRQRPKCPAKSRENSLGMAKIEKVNRGTILALDETNLQGIHEPGCCHPKVIPHHDQTLQPLAVTLPEGLHQIRVLLPSRGMEPLLELVEDDQNLLARRDASPLAQLRKHFGQVKTNRQVGTMFS